MELAVDAAQSRHLPGFLERFAQQQDLAAAAILPVAGGVPLDSVGQYPIRPSRDSHTVIARHLIEIDGAVQGTVELASRVPIDFVKKQLEIDPFDANANNYLGVTLVQQEKFDEAAAAFKKQIELNPLDNFAHASLGLLLEQQKKFAEALPELDKAAVLTPDNPQLQVSLGHAYLVTGKTTEAMAAFDKAVELAPTPEIWNNIAYDLVQKNVNLDKAQSYAQSAVDATAAALRNIDIDHVTANDLGEVQNIGAYWDTLGWIYFTSGNFEHAEPSLRASWQLTQNGDVGDHLAQLYEKQGKKKEAIRTYAQAATAPHADADVRARQRVRLGGGTPRHPFDVHIAPIRKLGADHAHL